MSQSMLRWSVDVQTMRFVILFHMLLNPSFKMITSLAKIARITDSTSRFIY